MTNTSFSTWPSFSKEEADEVSKVLLSNNVNYWTGNAGKKFEKEFASWADSRFSIALANGTVALDLALKSLNIGIDDEVIVTSRSFIASVSTIVNSGATPIFADVDLNSQNITAASIKLLITNKTKAVICVHLAGWPCEMDDIMRLSKEFNLYVIEDCSQAHGAKYKGHSVGSIGHIGTWSFCQDKIMSTGGEGGMITTNDEVLWRSMWAYKDHGKSFEAIYEREKPLGFQWVHESFGTNWRMTEMQATIGSIQLKRMDDWHTKRLLNANRIWSTAKESKGLRVPDLKNYIEHAAYKCYVFIEPMQLKKRWNRDRIIMEIEALGVPCLMGSCSEIYLEKAFDNKAFKPKNRLANAKKLGETSLMFLVHPTLTEIELQKTCDTIRSVMKLATI